MTGAIVKKKEEAENRRKGREEGRHAIKESHMEEDKSNLKLQMQRLTRKSLFAYLVSGNLQELLEDLFPPNLSHIHHKETTIQLIRTG